MKFICILIICILFSISFIIAETIKLKVNILTANIRELPSKNSKIIMHVPKDTVLEASDKIDEWYVVAIPGKLAENGFISDKTVSVIGSETKPESTIVAKPKTQKPEIVKEYKKERKQETQEITYAEHRKKFRIYALGGYTMKNKTFTDSWTFAAYQENGTFNGSYKIKSGFSIAGGASYMFMDWVGAMGMFHYFPGKESVAIHASIPHPFYFNKFRDAQSQDSSFKFTEMSIDADILVVLIQGKKLPVYAFGGLTIFSIKYDLVNKIQWSETYPYDTAQITTLTKEQDKVTRAGLNIGVIVNYMLSERAGICGIISYSRQRYEVPGGLKALAGIALAF